jgi:hypothetical protein
VNTLRSLSKCLAMMLPFQENRIDADSKLR